MAIKSLGERLGFVSAGDVRRARENQIRIESEKRGEIRGEIRGEKRGEKRGEIRGEEKGRKAERQKAEADKLESAKNLLQKGISRDIVVESLKLTDEQVAML